MKKILYVFLLGCFLVIGMMIGKPSRDTASDQIQDEIEDFEDNISSPNNNYSPDKRKDIEPNISNDLAKKGENLISGVFDYAFSFIESFIR